MSAQRIRSYARYAHEETGISIKNAQAVLDVVFKSLSEALVQEQDVSIPYLGHLRLRHTKRHPPDVLRGYGGENVTTTESCQRTPILSTIRFRKSRYLQTVLKEYRDGKVRS